MEYQSTDHSATQAADSDTTRLDQESCPLTAAMGIPKRKRNVHQIDAEEQADRAATEIVDLVEQDAQRSASSLTGSSPSPDMHIPSPSITPGTVARSTFTEQEEEVAISQWVITESREMNREVTPPVQIFLRPGERQDGDCGPAAVIGTMYYIYCQAGVTRVALETLLAYRAIRLGYLDQLGHLP